MLRTGGSMIASVRASRTPSMCRTGARRGTRGRSCPSAPQTCTDLAGTPPGAWSSRGPTTPSASSTPTRLACTPSAVRTQRRRSCLTKCPVRPTRTPRRRGWPWRCRRSSGPGLPGTCATRCSPAASRIRPQRRCRSGTRCSWRFALPTSIQRYTVCTYQYQLERSNRHYMRPCCCCHRMSGQQGRICTCGSPQQLVPRTHTVSRCRTRG